MTQTGIITANELKHQGVIFVKFNIGFLSFFFYKKNYISEIDKVPCLFVNL